MRERSHPEAVGKAFRAAIREVNRDLYGADYRPARDLGVGWLLGHERHKSGEPHGHAILFSMDDIEALLSRRQHWSRWYEDHGVNRLEAVRSSGDVVRYATKYCLKGGEIDFSDNFNAYVKFFSDERAA